MRAFDEQLHPNKSENIDKMEVLPWKKKKPIKADISTNRIVKMITLFKNGNSCEKSIHKISKQKYQAKTLLQNTPKLSISRQTLSYTNWSQKEKNRSSSTYCFEASTPFTFETKSRQR